MFSLLKTRWSTREGWNAWRLWTEMLLLLALLGSGLLWGVWRASAETAPASSTFAAELRACTHRVTVGYTTSGIRVSADDARTIHDACEHAVQERSPRPR